MFLNRFPYAYGSLWEINGCLIPPVPVRGVPVSRLGGRIGCPLYASFCSLSLVYWARASQGVPEGYSLTVSAVVFLKGPVCHVWLKESDSGEGHGDALIRKECVSWLPLGQSEYFRHFLWRNSDNLPFL